MGKKRKSSGDWKCRLQNQIYCNKGLRNWCRCVRRGLKEVEDVLCGK